MSSSSIASKPFVVLMLRLVGGILFLATFLIGDWALSSLVDATLDHHAKTVDTIIDGIQIASALGALILFLIHTARVVIDYLRWK